MTSLSSCTFIGAGGVAWSLAQALHKKGISIRQIFSRDLDNARKLAALTDAKPVDNPEEIDSESNLYIVSLADHAACDIINLLKPASSSLWVHTSGSLSKEVLSHLSPEYGVLYPLQTFSRGLTVDFSEVPIFVEGSSPVVTERLISLGNLLSVTVNKADADLRMKLHIAGVMSCNFVNHLWDTTDIMLRKNGLSIDVVIPLIRQTLDKISRISPHEAQTGPARRGDLNVITRHMAALSPDDAILYDMMSKRILKIFNTDNEQNQLRSENN